MREEPSTRTLGVGYLYALVYLVLPRSLGFAVKSFGFTGTSALYLSLKGIAVLKLF
jgi:hypothetical protein